MPCPYNDFEGREFMMAILRVKNKKVNEPDKNKIYTDNIKKMGTASIGKKELLKHLKNGKLSQKEAIFAHCYDCQGFYRDGQFDCENMHCPLYPFSPYHGIFEKND